ncbi:MAG TPA: DMT family transporter [Burkholderiaceae bacterium]|nr:DMT family transporter [Burkholderiaceae bacterium]
MNAIALAFAGGIVLAMQNLLLSAMAARGLAFPAVLLLNTLVGMALLLAINVATTGASFAGAVGSTWQPWFLLPGLLGTFVVFCMVFGYTRAGAAAPTIGLIAGQVLAALALDAIQIGPGSRPISLASVIGGLLVAAGAILVVLARR